jgi:hypothetical protein
MTSAIRLYRQGGTWAITTQANREVYYYEESKPTSVKSTNIQELELKIFPVPSNESLSIELTSGRAKSFCLTIAEINGRIHQQTTLPSTKRFAGKFSTEKMPGGNYILLVRDENGNTTGKSFTVVH